jgi:raffinose/stachyose/melibiose transport system substrate-binding protein
MEQAVFYQNGDWEYAALKDEDGKNGYLTANDEMTMIPIYFGVDDENQGLCVGTENHWAINAKASEDDIKASEDFLNWVVTSETGRSSVNEKMGLSAPFDTFTDEFAPKNEFSACAKNYKKSVAWAFNATPNVDDWRKDVVAPLTAYTDGSGDWSAVTEAFVTGWADQWKLAHEDDTAEVKAES